MNFEDRLVAFLNRRRSTHSRGASGIALGEGESLVARERTSVALRWTPVEHTFVCGRTGSGKTTLLMKVMAEHLRAGVPFLFVDFHGPATEHLITLARQFGRSKSCVVLEPWSDPVIGWNPLEADGDTPYAVVQELVSIFRHRLWPDAWGPRLEELLRMTLLALVEARLTLLETTGFLNRPEFRRAVLQRSTLPEVREFWAVRFERLSPSQRSLVTEPVLNKLSVFHDPALKYVIAQERGALDLERALEAGQWVIANVSTGRLRGNNFLLAALLVAKLKSAVYRRAAGAKPYGIFLDEFQEMVAMDALDDYLRSFRKFGCAVYLATQHLQFSPELKAAIFANCSRFCCFATSAADAAYLGREFGSPEGDLVADLLPGLPTGRAIVKVRGDKAYAVRVAAPQFADRAEIEDSHHAAVRGAGRRRADVDREIEERVAGIVRGSARAPKNRHAAAKRTTDTKELAEGYETF